MKLVIAEKPSVAQSLAKVIGANKRCDGYLEGGGYLVSWCVGHLVELSAPERYDERFGSIIFFVGLTMPRYRFSMPSVSLDMNPKQCFRGSIPTATNSRTARPRHRSIAWESCQGQALTGGWIVPLRLGI